MYKKGVKRAFDIIISLIIIVLLFPLFFLVCLLSLLVHGKPLFYTQKRPGLNGDVFKIIKECENGRDINSLLKGKVCHDTFKRLA